MDMRETEAFLAVAEQLHFGRAAERLRLTTSHVSQVIRRLERRVGAPLFERTSRRVALTPLGQRLFEELQPAYAQMLTAFEHARAAARTPVGRLRLGFTSSAEGSVITRVVKAFEARHDCSIAMHEVPTLYPYAPLRAGEIDILVNWLLVEEPDLVLGPVLYRRDRVLAVGVDHPLAGRQSVALEEVGDYGVAGVPQPAEAILDAIVPLETPSGRPIRRTHHIQTLHEALSLIARGRIVHPTMAGALPQRPDIRYVPMPELPPIPMGLIWRATHENAAIRALADLAAGF